MIFRLVPFYKRFAFHQIKFYAMSISSEDSPLYGTNEVSSGYESFILQKKWEKIIQFNSFEA